MLTCSHEFLSQRSVDEICTECGNVISMQENQAMKKPVAITGVAKRKRRPYKPRRTPAILREKRMRREVKIDMLAQIPGVSRVQAEAVVAAYEDSMARMVGASATAFARVVYRGAPLGDEIGVAIWRALH